MRICGFGPFGQKFAPWTRIILVPIWVNQLVFMPITVLLLAILISVTSPFPGTVTDDKGNTINVKPGVQP
jgi:hypothetical protein